MNSEIVSFKRNVYLKSTDIAFNPKSLLLFTSNIFRALLLLLLLLLLILLVFFNFSTIDSISDIVLALYFEKLFSLWVKSTICIAKRASLQSASLNGC